MSTRILLPKSVRNRERNKFASMYGANTTVDDTRRMMAMLRRDLRAGNGVAVFSKEPYYHADPERRANEERDGIPLIRYLKRKCEAEGWVWHEDGEAVTVMGERVNGHAY